MVNNAFIIFKYIVLVNFPRHRSCSGTWITLQEDHSLLTGLLNISVWGNFFGGDLDRKFLLSYRVLDDVECIIGRVKNGIFKKWTTTLGSELSQTLRGELQLT